MGERIVNFGDLGKNEQNRIKDMGYTPSDDGKTASKNSSSGGKQTWSYGGKTYATEQEATQAAQQKIVDTNFSKASVTAQKGMIDEYSGVKGLGQAQQNIINNIQRMQPARTNNSSSSNSNTTPQVGQTDQGQWLESQRQQQVLRQNFVSPEMMAASKPSFYTTPIQQTNSGSLNAGLAIANSNASSFSKAAVGKPQPLIGPVMPTDRSGLEGSRSILQARQYSEFGGAQQAQSLVALNSLSTDKGQSMLPSAQKSRIAQINNSGFSTKNLAASAAIGGIVFSQSVALGIGRQTVGLAVNAVTRPRETAISILEMPINLPGYVVGQTTKSLINPAVGLGETAGDYIGAQFLVKGITKGPKSIYEGSGWAYEYTVESGKDFLNVQREMFADKSGKIGGRSARERSGAITNAQKSKISRMQAYPRNSFFDNGEVGFRVRNEGLKNIYVKERVLRYDREGQTSVSDKGIAPDRAGLTSTSAGKNYPELGSTKIKMGRDGSQSLSSYRQNLKEVESFIGGGQSQVQGMLLMKQKPKLLSVERRTPSPELSPSSNVNYGNMQAQLDSKGLTVAGNTARQSEFAQPQARVVRPGWRPGMFERFQTKSSEKFGNDLSGNIFNRQKQPEPNFIMTDVAPSRPVFVPGTSVALRNQFSGVEMFRPAKSGMPDLQSFRDTSMTDSQFFGETSLSSGRSQLSLELLRRAERGGQADSMIIDVEGRLVIEPRRLSGTRSIFKTGSEMKLDISESLMLSSATALSLGAGTMTRSELGLRSMNAQATQQAQKQAQQLQSPFKYDYGSNIPTPRAPTSPGMPSPSVSLPPPTIPSRWQPRDNPPPPSPEPPWKPIVDIPPPPIVPIITEHIGNLGRDRLARSGKTRGRSFSYTGSIAGAALNIKASGTSAKTSGLGIRGVPTPQIKKPKTRR